MGEYGLENMVPWQQPSPPLPPRHGGPRRRFLPARRLSPGQGRRVDAVDDAGDDGGVNGYLWARSAEEQIGDFKCMSARVMEERVEIEKF